MFRLGGWLYSEGRFRNGGVTIDDGVIVDVERTPGRALDARGLILPAFTNAHTHAGDAVVRQELAGNVEELVAPPHGLKHRVLARASDAAVVAASRDYLERMARGGTQAFWDFREMGLRGIRQLYEAALGLPLRPKIFGRPSSMRYNRDEVRAILRACDGIGISSRLDWEPRAAAKLAKDAHDARKVFATHASERIREDIDDVLELKPDLLVHLTEATESDLSRVADEGIPVVVCPRSNAFFGKILDLPRLARSGVPFFLGTDNAMVNGPSMFREMDFAWKLARLKGGVAPRVILDAALAGRKGLTASPDVALAPGDPADVIVLDVAGEPTFGGVFRSGEADLGFVGLGGRAWLRKDRRLVELAPPKAGTARRRTPRQHRRARSARS